MSETINVLIVWIVVKLIVTCVKKLCTKEIDTILSIPLWMERVNSESESDPNFYPLPNWICDDNDNTQEL